MTFDQKIQIAIAIGTCSAAVATSAAVVFSLIQTRLATRSRLRVNVVLAEHGGRPDLYGDATEMLPALKIQVANHGQRPVYLTTVGWKAGRFFSRVTKSQNMTDGWPLPSKVEPSEYATFWVVPDGWDRWLKAFAEEVLVSGHFGSKPYLRLAVMTSLGEQINTRLPADVLVELTRHASPKRKLKAKRD